MIILRNVQPRDINRRESQLQDATRHAFQRLTISSQKAARFTHLKRGCFRCRSMGGRLEMLSSMTAQKNLY